MADDVRTRIEDIYGAVALERLRTEQHDKLLPQLKRKRQRFSAKRDAVASELEVIDAAIETVEQGHITDYQMRKPRGAKAAEPDQDED